MITTFKSCFKFGITICLIIQLLFACRPDPILPPGPSSIILEAKVPTMIYSNVKKVILDASETASLNGKRALFFSWVCTSYPLSFGSPLILFKDQPTAFVENLTIGEYIFQLTVKDNLGNFNVSTFQMKVMLDSIAGNIPLAKAGPDQQITAPMHHVELDCSETIANNPLGRPLNYIWTVIMQPAGSGQVILLNNINITTIADHLDAGLYKFQLEVKNEYGAVAFDTVEVQVMPDPLKGTTRIFENLKWKLEGNDGWGYAIAIILNDPHLFINRYSRNMEVQVWDEEKNEWLVADKYYWYTTSSGELYIELIVDGDNASYYLMNGVKTKVKVTFN